MSVSTMALLSLQGVTGSRIIPAGRGNNSFPGNALMDMPHRDRFQQLTRPWQARLLGVALRYARERETAEDWVQETLLRAWRDFDSLTDTTAVYAWLLRILDRVMADDIRRQRRRQHLAPVITVDDELLQAHPAAAPGPFENLLQSREHARLEAAVMALPEPFSRVVMLRDLEGLPYREIARILGIPPGTVMSRLSRGRRLLAASLLRDAPAATTRRAADE